MGDHPGFSWPRSSDIDAIVRSAMQAAISEDRTEMVALLLSHGLKANVEKVCEWLELAGANHKKEAMRYLRSTFPTESASCASQPVSEGR